VDWIEAGGGAQTGRGETAGGLQCSPRPTEADEAQLLAAGPGRAIGRGRESFFIKGLKKFKFEKGVPV
jgi:hypothetical protein